MNKEYKFAITYEEDYITAIKMQKKEVLCIEEKNKNREIEDDKNTEINKIINNLIKGLKYEGKIKYRFKGTEFQERVWKEIEKIPYGQTRTYKDIATAIGNSKASRAVGKACNKNPLPIIIPCHRVISTSGSINGYIYGNDMKAYILGNENKNKIKYKILEK